MDRRDSQKFAEIRRNSPKSPPFSEPEIGPARVGINEIQWNSVDSPKFAEIRRNSPNVGRRRISENPESSDPQYSPKIRRKFAEHSPNIR
jgi:hypothetical protein